MLFFDLIWIKSITLLPIKNQVGFKFFGKKHRYYYARRSTNGRTWPAAGYRFATPLITDPKV